MTITEQNIPFGKRIKSKKDLVMFHRFPDSPDRKILSAGKPSPIVESFLPTGFIVVKGDSKGEYFIKNSSEIEVVEPDAKDTSKFFDNIFDAGKGFFSNKKRDVEAKAGFLKDGFEKTIEEGTEFSSLFNSDLKKYGIGLISILTLIAIIKIFK